MGFLQITSRIGSALAPWVAKWLRVFHASLPFSIMGVLSLVAAVLSLSLPDTKDRQTLETLEELFNISPGKKKADTLIMESNGKAAPA